MYNKGPDYDGNGAKPIQAQPYGTGLGVTNVQPIIVNNAQGQQSFVPQAQPTFNAMGNNNNNNGSPMCTMVKEDLMKIITDSGYGQTNPAMFNTYFQQRTLIDMDNVTSMIFVINSHFTYFQFFKFVSLKK